MQTMMEMPQVVILVGRGGKRRWAKHLAERLRVSLGQQVSIRFAATEREERLLPFERLDRTLHGATSVDLSAWLETGEFQDRTERLTTSDIVIDTLGEECPSFDTGSAMMLTAEIEGRRGRDGLLAALSGGSTVRVSIVASGSSPARHLLRTSICIPGHDPVGGFLDTVFARLITLFDAAVRHLLTGRPLPLTGVEAAKRLDNRKLHYGLSRKVAAKARRLAHSIIGPLVRTADWTIGVRRLGDPERILHLPAPDGLQLLPSDHGHFVADPMLLTYKDSTYLFFEEMNHASGIGSLGCVTVGADGALSEPVSVMTRPTHLSYPFVFSHEGEVFMIPETSADRRVELWRAVQLPDRWELVAVLIEGIDAVDATVKFDERQQLWWMFVSVAEPGGSTFDTLSIYFSKELARGWTAHPLNPVKLDPTSSRPAGPIREEGRDWLRPAQDCSRGYGGALAWCRVSDLTPHTFHEEVVKRWSPPSGYRGLHTYTRTDKWEAIDLQRRRWRWQ
jgi:hypothetical protein